MLMTPCCGEAGAGCSHNGGFQFPSLQKNLAKEVRCQNQPFPLLFQMLSPSCYEENWGEGCSHISHSNIPLTLIMIRNVPFLLLLLQAHSSENLIMAIKSQLPTFKSWCQLCYYVAWGYVIACA